MKPHDPLAGFPQGLRRPLDDVFIGPGHLQQVLPAAFVALFGGQPPGFVDMAANPPLNAPDRPLVQVVEVLLFGRAVDCPIAGDLVEQSSPAQPKPHLVIGGEVGVVADAVYDVVTFDPLAQMIVGIIRIPLVGAHLRHEIAPAPRQRVVGIDVDLMDIHQAAKIPGPCVEPVERAVRMVRNNPPHPFPRDDPAVVVLVQNALLFDLLLGLPQLFRFQPGKFAVVIRMCFHKHQFVILSIDFAKLRSVSNRSFESSRAPAKGFSMPHAANLSNPSV